MQDLKSPHAATRRAAVERQTAHLGDDELFAMSDLLRDRSQGPVAGFLREALRRDPGRTVGLLLGHSRLGPRVAAALVGEIGPAFQKSCGALERAAVYRAVLLRASMDVGTAWEMLLLLSLDLDGEGRATRRCS